MINGTLTRVCGYLLMFVFASTGTSTVSAKSGTSKPAPVSRVMLPTAVTPDHYRIDIAPDATTLTFKGSVAIDITVHQATDVIVLNSVDIVIDSAALAGEALPLGIRYDEAAQTAILALDHKLKPGAYTLTLVYHGRIYEQTSGLFYLDYDTPKGKVRALFTKFEDSDARRFVPSWDEPGRKATFQLTATVPADQMALSNMPITATDALPRDMKRVHFGVTPRMSSYLLFFGVGDFERVHRSVAGVDVGVVVKRGDTASAAYALDTASSILPYYNRYFGTPYPLPKLDLIAAPGSSQRFSAMENWGAIFYFERYLLVDPRISTKNDEQDVYITIAHEMAHQWFGNLVTMAWWDDLWLNEGFASWMQSKVADHFHPEWKVWLQSLGYKQRAMGVDAREGTHPIITPINDVLQANGAFDTITYTKGASVIRTLESYVGEDAFRAGVRRYMHDYAYRNAVTDDLWKEMDKGSLRPITRIAHDFTLQAGVPMVIESSAECVHGKTTLRLAQSHFAIDADSTKARVWRVPVTIATIGDASTKTIISGAVPEPFNVAGCQPAILNAGQTAYFRSHYSNAGLAAISARYGALAQDDQLGVFYDTVSLAYAGEEPMAAFLDLTKNFPTGTDPVVESALVGQLQGLDQLYDGLPTQATFRTYARDVLMPVFAGVGWTHVPGESHNVSILRSQVIAALGEFGDPSVTSEVRKRFTRYIGDPSSLDAGARETVLRIVARHADRTIWDQLHTLARSAKTQVERQELYVLLAATEDDALVEEALELALSGEPPATSVPDMISMASRLHPQTAFDFAVGHWNQIVSLLEHSIRLNYVPHLAGGASDLKLIDKLNAFAEQYIPSGGRLDLRKSESNIRYLAKIRKDRLPEVDQWLMSQGH